ncbi:hypothetical protein ACIA5E_26255 [Nocardia asteroides]|uniref:hypothetical protein n=1 Tax=Nocardia asteroides TaxID=1824 RepID=UPI0037A044DF
MLAAVSVLLGIAFVLVPGMVAGWGSAGGIGDVGELRDALRVAFAQYWRSGAGELSPALNDVVDYWFRYHVVKAAIAVALLCALVALASALWKTAARDGGSGSRRGFVLGTAGAVVAMIAVVALVAVMANVQGAVAPYASILPMLFDTAVSPDQAGILDDVGRQLAVSVGAGAPPALALMIDDFTRYHVAMVVIAAVVAVGLLVASAALWRRRAGRSPGERRVIAGLGLCGVGLALVCVVVAVANTTTVADPVPALQVLFDGQW